MAFNIIIQLGAILAVMWEYRRKILITVFNVPRQREAQRFTANLLIAFLPAVVIGVAFADLIHEYLFNAITVAAALIIGGLVMLWAERRQHEVTVEEVDDMTWKEALKIGFAQCLAMIPGTSRSASTIIGGLLFGLSRRAATEFSFFLAMPTMVGAAVLLRLQAPRAVPERRRPAGIRPGLRGVLHLRHDCRARTAQVHRQPQLRGVRLVPHRLRSADPGHLAVPPDRLEQRSGLIWRSVAF